ncbi:MAG TPA: DedA family protein [Gaiellaceae bacterium]|nr:DedA family protein [Gaiellaceae bacterium]
MASVTTLLEDYGLVLLFFLVAIESAGIPLPGETALIAAAVLARPELGYFQLWEVIVVGALAAIVGDNVGYWLGRTGGRALIDRWAFVKRHADKVLPPSERFFKRHGGKTVFFGRFVAVLRVTVAWIAGISRMHWWQFFAWNAAGGILWATGVSLLAYWAGKAVADAVSRYGLIGAAVIVVLLALGYLALRAWRRRMVEDA